MEKIILKAEKRIEIGKGGARSLRRKGMLPAVLYGKGATTHIKLLRKDLTKLMSSHAVEHALIEIELSDNNAHKTNHLTLVKDYQLDPARGELLHVDFLEISLEKKVKIAIPIVVTKEPVGVEKGGILQQQMREIEVECLPTQIPDRIEVDASALEIGHSIHVSDLIVEEKIKVLSNPQEVVLSVSAPVVEEVAPPVAQEVVPTEPELVKKTKAKEEEIAEEKEKEKPKKEQKEK